MHRFRPNLHCVFLLCLMLGMASCGGDSNNNSGNNNTPTTPTGGGTGGGNSSTPSTVAVAYVGSRQLTIGGNGQITGFAVAPDGSAASTPNSPFTGASRTLAASKKFLVGSDGTNIVTYAIATNGGLSQVSSINGVEHNDSPDDSAVGTLSLDRSGSSVYASELNFQGADNDAFAMFNLASDGTLSFLANSDINVNFGGGLTFTPDNRFAYGDGCFFLGFTVFGFARNSDGTLTRLTINTDLPSAANNGSFCPGSLSPSSERFLALLIFSEGTGVSQGSIVLYKIGSDGSLTLANDSLLSVPNAVDVAFDPSGKFLAAATTAGIQMFQLSGTTLSAVGTPQDVNVSFDEVQWDNAGHLYGVSSKSNGLYIYNANQGVLTSASGSPHSVPSVGSFTVSLQSP